VIVIASLCLLRRRKEGGKFWEGILSFLGGVVYRERAYFIGIISQEPGKNP
jgi:hypothetical protein